MFLSKARIQVVAGLAMLGLGGLLLMAAVSYYAYGAVAGARANELSFSTERPTLANAEANVPNEPTDELATTNEATQSPPDLQDQIQSEDTAAADRSDSESEAGDATSDSKDGPVEAIHREDTVAEAQPVTEQLVETVQPQEIASTQNDEDAPDGGTGVRALSDSDLVGDKGPDDFLALTGSSSEAGEELHETSSADGLVASEVEDGLVQERLFSTRISIPAIGVDSGVQELRLLFADSGTIWETPKHVVGHVPSTAGPGEQGQGWYVGHLESPLRGEGNVFSNLPDVPGLLKQGEVVDVFLEADGRRYQYQVYHTEVLEAEELKVTHSGEQDITLVTCYPRLTYEKRLLVTAALVDVTDIEPS